MMYFESGKFIIDFVEISEFLSDYSVYAIVGIAGFLVGVIWHAIMAWKGNREQKRIEAKYNYDNSSNN